MSKILYMESGDNLCYDLDYFSDVAETREVDIELLEMKVDKSISERWCTYHAIPIDCGDCGKEQCNEYEAQNGARGKCRFKTFCYSETGRIFVLSNGELIEKNTGDTHEK